MQVTVHSNDKIGTISPLLYGHFAEHIGGVIYGGLWVGKDSRIPNINGFRLDIVEKLKRISPSVIRWPGGCFAETYDWRDGIGTDRPIRPSWWTRQDGLYENNAFGTHEFMEFCALVGAEPYLAINATSQTPMDARNWVDYCNSPAGTTTLAALREKNGAKDPFDVKFFGIGNENWGGGGTMCAQQYAWEYRKYATVVRNAAPNAKLVAGAANQHSIQWTESFLASLNETYGTPVQVDGLSHHYYFSDAEDVGFTQDGWDKLIGKAKKIEEDIQTLIALLEKEGRSGQMKLYFDEWGSMCSKGVNAKEMNQLFRQQVTQRDAVAVALTFNIFHRYCYAVEMANIAQLVNCLSALFLTDDDKCIETPVYHVFDMYRGHQGAAALQVETSDSEISVSASVKDDKMLITMANLSYSEDKQLQLELGKEWGSVAEITILSPENPNDYNDFDTPDRVRPSKLECDISQAVLLPRGAVIAISVCEK
jgi:alpha-N-arabinofuranosidase